MCVFIRVIQLLNTPMNLRWIIVQKIQKIGLHTSRTAWISFTNDANLWLELFGLKASFLGTYPDSDWEGGYWIIFHIDLLNSSIPHFWWAVYRSES